MDLSDENSNLKFELKDLDSNRDYVIICRKDDSVATLKSKVASVTGIICQMQTFQGLALDVIEDSVS